MSRFVSINLFFYLFVSCFLPALVNKDVVRSVARLNIFVRLGLIDYCGNIICHYQKSFPLYELDYPYGVTYKI